MFDVGWSEMAIIAVVILVVLGPKELPHALKTMSHWLRAARKLGAEFQSGVNEIVRDAELEDARKQLQGITKNTIEKKIGAAIDPTGDIKKAMTETAEAAKLDEPAAVSAPASTPAGEAKIAETAPGAAGIGAVAGSAPTDISGAAPVETGPGTGSAASGTPGAAVVEKSVSA
jgi:sec-independent protein translocase protein TatB